METTASGQANGDRVYPASDKKDVSTPSGIVEAARQALDNQRRADEKLGDQTVEHTELNKNNTTSDAADNGQASRLPNGRQRGRIPPHKFRIPPGMTVVAWLAAREEKLRQYREELKLAEETAKNTELNKNITTSGHSYRNTELNKKVKCNSASFAS
ncbi:hypothetical protein DL546_006464 [Coniochaeta pulveracea]|uniref:Uncharacterized protein n=1 Tax=Coniochaeta pulveracea TaxID=177199 RepID=A0A420Y756_9PEZI|nr:hypothetical protein DL546_006464 [Coniochaeta pulveracea]